MEQLTLNVAGQPNPRSALDAGFPLGLHIGSQFPGASESERYALRENERE